MRLCVCSSLAFRRGTTSTPPCGPSAWPRRSPCASRAPGVRFLGNDIHPGALSLCERDAKAAGVWPLLQLSCGDVAECVPSSPPSLVVVNPPLGVSAHRHKVRNRFGNSTLVRERLENALDWSGGVLWTGVVVCYLAVEVTEMQLHHPGGLGSPAQGEEEGWNCFVHTEVLTLQG